MLELITTLFTAKNMLICLAKQRSRGPFSLKILIFFLVNTLREATFSDKTKSIIRFHPVGLWTVSGIQSRFSVLNSTFPLHYKELTAIVFFFNTLVFSQFSWQSALIAAALEVIELFFFLPNLASASERLNWNNFCVCVCTVNTPRLGITPEPISTTESLVILPMKKKP